MANFARLSSLNEVVEIIVINDDDILDSDGNVSETLGQEFCARVLEGRYPEDHKWIMCCIDGAMRHKYPGVGWFYSEEYDAFIEPQPFKSWTLNTQTLEWDPPIPYPDPLTEQQILDGYFYSWNEYEQKWDLRTMSAY